MIPKNKLIGPASIVEVYSFPQKILPYPESDVSKYNFYEPEEPDLVLNIEHFNEFFIET
jgi:hypothetical protein